MKLGLKLSVSFVLVLLVGLLLVNAAEYTTDPYTVALYHFNEGLGNITYDSSGNGYNGIMGTSVNWTLSAKLGPNAICFNPQSDPDNQSKSTFSYQALNNISQGTVEMWVKPSLPSVGYSTVISKSLDPTHYLVIMWDTSVNAIILDGNPSLKSSNNSVPPDVWTHIAIVWDPSATKIYINGNLDAVLTGGVDVIDSTEPLYLGGYNQVSGFGYNFVGCIDELRISNIARTSFNVNRIPNLTSNIPNQTFNEDTNTTINLSNYFSDQNDTLNYSASGNININVQINNDIVTLTPNSNWNGQEIITFRATDSYNNSVDSNPVTITINPVNDVPIINSITPTSPTSIDEGSSLSLTIDTIDLDNDTLTYKWYLDSTQVSTNQNYTYNPDYNSQGNHNITIIVSDSLLETPQYWNVTVNDVPQSPPSGGGGGGGGGGGSCTPKWNCIEWTPCSEKGKQTRTCTDLNYCGKSENKPIEIQDCSYTKPTEEKPTEKEETEEESPITGMAVKEIEGKGIGPYVKEFVHNVKEFFVKIGQSVKSFVMKLLGK